MEIIEKLDDDKKIRTLKQYNKQWQFHTMQEQK